MVGGGARGWEQSLKFEAATAAGMYAVTISCASDSMQHRMERERNSEWYFSLNGEGPSHAISKSKSPWWPAAQTGAQRLDRSGVSV